MTTDQTRPDTASDEDLLARIAGARDRDAFALLFHRYAGRVKAYLMRGGLSPERAEDLAQEVMVTLWRRADSFDPARAGAATWIYTIARNRRIDLARRDRRPEPDPTDPIFAPDPGPEPLGALIGAQRDAAIRAALATLSPDQRAVVTLCFFDGLTHPAVAERLGLPLGTVKSRLRLAFGHLRAHLGPGGAD